MKISNQSLFIRCVLSLVLIIQLVLFLLSWSSTQLGMGHFFMMEVSVKGLDFSQMQALSGAQRMLGASLSLLPLGVLWYGFWNLYQLLSNCNQSNMFTTQSIGRIRNFSAAILLSTILSILELPLRSILFKIVLHQPLQKLAVGINSEQLLILLLGLVFFLLINMLHTARQLSEENQEFI